MQRFRGLVVHKYFIHVGVSDPNKNQSSRLCSNNMSLVAFSVLSLVLVS